MKVSSLIHTLIACAIISLSASTALAAEQAPPAPPDISKVSSSVLFVPLEDVMDINVEWETGSDYKYKASFRYGEKGAVLKDLHVQHPKGDKSWSWSLPGQSDPWSIYPALPDKEAKKWIAFAGKIRSQFVVSDSMIAYTKPVKYLGLIMNSGKDVEKLIFEQSKGELVAISLDHWVGDMPSKIGEKVILASDGSLTFLGTVVKDRVLVDASVAIEMRTIRTTKATASK